MCKATYIAAGAVGVVLLWGMLQPAQASYIIQTAYNLVTDEGSPLTRRTTLDFTGAGVGCADAGGVTRCTIAGATTNYSQSFVAQTTVTLTDNLNTTNKLVQCYSSASPAVLVEPDSVTLTDANTTTVGFAVAQSGFCIVNGAQSGTTSQLLQATITLTSNQLLNLTSSPVVLVAAPGAGKVIVPLAGTFVMTAATQYVNPGAGAMNLGYNTSTLAACQAASNLNSYVTSAATITGLCGPSSSVNPVANVPLQFNKAGANFTTGTGTLYYSLTYTVVATQ